MTVQYINKADVAAMIKKIYNEDYKFLPSDIVESVQEFKDELLTELDTLKVKEVDLSDRKPDWHPNKKQIESLGALVRYNIGVFDYQKLNEVALLYEDLTKILDYETDRQK